MCCLNHVYYYPLSSCACTQTYFYDEVQHIHVDYVAVRVHFSSLPLSQFSSSLFFLGLTHLSVSHILLTSLSSFSKSLISFLFRPPNSIYYVPMSPMAALASIKVEKSEPISRSNVTRVRLSTTEESEAQASVTTTTTIVHFLTYQSPLGDVRATIPSGLNL